MINSQPKISLKQPATPTGAASLGVRLHGVTLALEANHPPLIAYAAEHLQGLVETPVDKPDLLVKCFWSQGEWNAQSNPFEADGALNVIGKRMFGNANEFIWLDTLRMPGLQLRFRRENGQWLFEVAYCFPLGKKKAEKLPEYEYKKYFSLMSYLVYYPLIWYLENFRGWTVLHASALATDRGGVIIGGLGGVGKTTTCVALMQRAGVKLMAENIIFTDGKFIYPCYEPIRLDEGSLAMLGCARREENPQGLKPMVFPDGLKKKWLFHFSSNALPEQVGPALLFLPQFSPRRYLAPLAPALAAEKMVAMNRLTRELDDYGWYASALDMTWPRAGQAANRVEVLRRLAESARCFELGIDRSAGVQAVVEDILSTINSPEVLP
jgi:hypothetical protein